MNIKFLEWEYDPAEVGHELSIGKDKRLPISKMGEFVETPQDAFDVLLAHVEEVAPAQWYVLIVRACSNALYVRTQYNLMFSC